MQQNMSEKTQGKENAQVDNTNIKNIPQEDKSRRRSSLFFGTQAPVTPQHIPFRVKRNFPLETRLQTLLMCIETMMDKQKLDKTVEPPPETSLNEWISAYIRFHYNEINDLYGYLSTDKCVCEKMSIGRKWEYLWADGKTIRNPINIPANDYIDYLMTWIEANLDDTKIFPDYDGAKYSKEYSNIVKVIVKRLFRVYGHIVINHEEDLVTLNIYNEAEFALKSLTAFTLKYKLMERKNFKPFAKLIKRWKEDQEFTTLIGL